MTGRPWVSLHAFYHGDLDVLLLDAVRPLLADLLRRSLIDGYFFLRYWDGGQHIRLRLRPVSTSDNQVRGFALGWLRGYLAASPASDFPDIDRYAELAPWFAAREGVTDYLREPLPNNTVHEIPYVPETDRYGHGVELAAVEQHFVESSRIALGLIAAGASRDQRHTAALAAILLAWRGTEPRHPAPAPEFEARYLDSTPVVRAVAAQVDEIADGTTSLPAAGALTAWWQSIRQIANTRVADICAHLLCNRLGLTLADERYLRYLAARYSTEKLRPVGGQ